MCRSHFLVAFVFVGTDFNCFLNSIRRSIPMTVAVKLTSTRRCMTCSFFVGFFVFIEREICLYARGHCGAVRGFAAQHSWSYFGLHSRGTHSNFEFNGWNQLRMCDEWRGRLLVINASNIRVKGNAGMGLDGLWNINNAGAHSGHHACIIRQSAPLYRQQKNRASLFLMVTAQQWADTSHLLLNSYKIKPNVWFRLRLRAGNSTNSTLFIVRKQICNSKITIVCMKLKRLYRVGIFRMLLFLERFCDLLSR